jgi:hypothetical protein
LRCFPFEQPTGDGLCIITGQTAARVALFARSY